MERPTVLEALAALMVLLICGAAIVAVLFYLWAAFPHLFPAPGAMPR